MFILAKSILCSNSMILSAQISFFSSYYPNLYFVRPLSFFCFISFISLYKSNPYFADAPMISLLKIFYCFTDTNLILLLTIIFFLLPFLLFLCIIQIHTFFKPHDFSAQILFFSSYYPNSYFVTPPSFFFVSFYYFSIYSKSMLRLNFHDFSFSIFFSFFTNNKSILCLTPIFFLP